MYSRQKRVPARLVLASPTSETPESKTPTAASCVQPQPVTMYGARASLTSCGTDDGVADYRSIDLTTLWMKLRSLDYSDQRHTCTAPKVAAREKVYPPRDWGERSNQTFHPLDTQRLEVGVEGRRRLVAQKV